VARAPSVGISLCAGGGGLDMGLGLAEPGFASAVFCDIDEYPRTVLAAAQAAGYFHPAPIWDDLKRFSGRPWNGIADTLLAGYPCQPFSQAGQRKGADDPRHIWPHIARIVAEIDSLEWLFFENVAGHVTLGLSDVLRDIRGLGFTPAVGLFMAAETGAAHERLRLFIVAHRDRHQSGTDRREPHTGADRRHDVGGGCGTVANGNSRRREPFARHGGLREPQRGVEGVATVALNYSRPLHAPGPADMASWHDTIVDRGRLDLLPAASLDDARLWADYHAAALGSAAQAAAEPAVRRMADGLAARSRALRLLGNGVHPLVAGYAWRTLAAAHGLGGVDFGGTDA
jgi:DNA (cytosine-5)-methyltransferase 1